LGHLDGAGFPEDDGSVNFATRPICALALLLMSGAPPAIAARAGPTEAAARVVEVARSDRLAGEIALADHGRITLDRVLGLADREHHNPHRTGARWLWASVTKQVTATLVMQEVEAGRIVLDRPIRAYLPQFVGPSGDKVTVRQLLQHTSGLPNPDDTPPDAQTVPRFYTETGARIGDGARAQGYCAGTPKANPGTGFSYNNCDYLVLGAILERVTGRSFAALAAERIARPLGLRSVRLAVDGAPRGGAASIGYTTGGLRYPPINVATFGAAGALTGTARDLLAIDLALASGKLLKDPARSVLWGGDPKLGYEALGVWAFPATLRGCAAPVMLIERRGDVGGTQVRNVIAPEIGRALAVFTNDDSVDFGEVWQGKGPSFDLLSAAFCEAKP
jgi:CubicO group peptidase (beta-lactamase class C family)